MKSSLWSLEKHETHSKQPQSHETCFFFVASEKGRHEWSVHELVEVFLLLKQTKRPGALIMYTESVGWSAIHGRTIERSRQSETVVFDKSSCASISCLMQKILGNPFKSVSKIQKCIVVDSPNTGIRYLNSIIPVMGLASCVKFGRNLLPGLLNVLKNGIECTPRIKWWYPQSGKQKRRSKTVKPKMELTRWEEKFLLVTSCFKKFAERRTARDRKQTMLTLLQWNMFPMNLCWSASNNATRLGPVSALLTSKRHKRPVKSMNHVSNPRPLRSSHVEHLGCSRIELFLTRLRGVLQLGHFHLATQKCVI